MKCLHLVDATLPWLWGGASSRRWNGGCAPQMSHSRFTAGSWKGALLHAGAHMFQPGKGNSNFHGARPVHLIITMIKWIRNSRLSMKNSLPTLHAPEGSRRWSGGSSGHAFDLNEFGLVNRIPALIKLKCRPNEMKCIPVRP